MKTPQEGVTYWKPIYFLIVFILARLPFGFGKDHQAHVHGLGVKDYNIWGNMIPLSTDAVLSTALSSS